MDVLLTGDDHTLRPALLPIPAPGADQLLVRTRAVALNNADLDRSGAEHIAGYEFAGEVIDVGADLDPSLIGTRVAGTAPAAFAQYVRVHHRHVITLPDALSFEDAASLPTALLTESGALSVAGIGPGDSVLITAASSGIGLIGVQLARLRGVTPVIATTRSAHKRELLEQLGADIVINTLEQDVVPTVLSATNGRGATAVLDHIGADMIAATIPATSSGGKMISVGRLSGSMATVDLFALARHRVTLHAVSYGFTPPEVIGDLLGDLASQVLPALATGRFTAVVDSVVPLASAAAALERLGSGQAMGKIVLRMR
ncbi:alcohol dehydrogenase [Arthrobacter sp. 7749]|nr:alcohol dehydrogenase [Arthrobacter sp. 7749]